jgi:peptide-methionine (S)-S-oxide reductase
MKSVFSLLTVTLLSLFALGASSADKGTARVEEYAIFAGGCFWCVEADFDKVPGVLETISGYVGGHLLDPTYEQVSAGGTGHAEAVRVTFDPQTVSYAELLDVFWRSIDPTTVDSQFCDHGDQYRTAIFYTTSAQEVIARQSLASLMQSKPFCERTMG